MKRFWSINNVMKDKLKQNDLYSVTLDITNKCHGGCKFCYNSSVENTSHGLDTQKIYDLIDEISDLDGKIITWSGGEPFLREELYDFIEYAYKKNIKSKIATAGYPLALYDHVKKIKELADRGILELLRIQINSINKEDFLAVRNTKDTLYDDVLQGIENLRKISFPIYEKLSICVVYLDPSIKSFNETIEWMLNDLKINPGNIMTVNFQLQGLGKHNKYLENDSKNIDECREYLANKMLQLGHLNEFSTHNCGTVIHIFPNGDFTPCALINVPCGNINKNTLKELFESGAGCSALSINNEIIELAKKNGEYDKKVCGGNIYNTNEKIRNYINKKYSALPH